MYRRYASLFFVCGIGAADNELITLEIVHRYVEVLDRYFGNVRPLLCASRAMALIVPSMQFIPVGSVMYRSANLTCECAVHIYAHERDLKVLGCVGFSTFKKLMLYVYILSCARPLFIDS